jgi:aspartyl-tRNA(Asn)/glutamyl-tRNA(Gln) amidotransferase subunit A
MTERFDQPDAAVHDDALCFYSVDQLASAYRSGALSPLTVAQAMFARIARVNPRLAAYYVLDEAGALAAARASESRHRAGTALGALDGVPVSIKDHIDVAGMASPRGMPLAAASAATQDSPATARLREAGALIMGKTTMPELSVIPVTHTRAFGITRNPCNTAHSPGGSSGGGAAAAAAGLCTIAIGSDGGGSIRLPASFTNLVGHKPTLGRVPYHPGQTDRTVAGPLARSARDCAHAMNAIARPDGRDWMELPPDDTDYVAALAGASLKGLRVAYSPNYGYQKVDAAVAACVDAAVEAIARAGATVTPIATVCRDPFRAYMIQAGLRLRAGKRRDDEPPAVASMLDFAATITPEDLQSLLDERNRIGADLLGIFSAHDVLVSPASPVVAPLVGEFYPDGDTLGEANRNLIGFTCPVNLVHMPALSVGCRRTVAGLPVGLQIAGAKFSDARLLAIAELVEGLGLG